MADLLETMEARKKWSNTFKVLKEKDCQPKVLYLTKFPSKLKEYELRNLLQLL
jgi:hypothetical protein